MFCRTQFGFNNKIWPFKTGRQAAAATKLSWKTGRRTTTPPIVVQHSTVHARVLRTVCTRIYRIRKKIGMKKVINVLFLDAATSVLASIAVTCVNSGWDFREKNNIYFLSLFFGKLLSPTIE